MAFARIAEFPDFQAEYEGSIPFTRSNVFNCLDEMGILIPTKRAESLNQTFETNSCVTVWRLKLEASNCPLPPPMRVKCSISHRH